MGTLLIRVKRGQNNNKDVKNAYIEKISKVSNRRSSRNQFECGIEEQEGVNIMVQGSINGLG